MSPVSKAKTYTIPVSKLSQSLNQCFYSALNFWQGGSYAAERGSLHIAVGLWVLALEEVGKYVLLEEAATNADATGILEIRIRNFMDHTLKATKGLSLFKKWGIDLTRVGIPLTSKTRTRLWFVAWDDTTQAFKREFGELYPFPISKTSDLGELLRRGLNEMHKLQRMSSI